MRYFLVSGNVVVNNDLTFDASLSFSSETFPSRLLIQKKFIESYELATGNKGDNYSGVFVENLFEFENEKDYNDYNGIKTEPIEKEMD